MLFSAFAIFLFHLFHIWQNVSLWGLLSSRETKVTWGEMGCIGRVGYKGHAVFGQKLLNTQWIGRCAGKLPIMKWANMLQESSKKFTEVKCFLSQHQLVHWYRWVPRILTSVLPEAPPPEDNSVFFGRVSPHTIPSSVLSPVMSFQAWPVSGKFQWELQEDPKRDLRVPLRLIH